MSAKVVSFINLKGGVAKTTTTVGLAHILSAAHGKKVLVIDLDPQTNATVMLIGEEKWHELDGKSNTLATLFADALNDSEDFKLGRVLQKSAGDVVEAKTVDLLPSSLQLIGLQDKITLTPGGMYGTQTPVTILLRGIQNLIADYDYVLVDCPPNLGYITLNGLRISDGYVIPTIPDILSTYGIPQIVTRIHAFSRDIFKETGRSVQPYGIVPTKYRAQAQIHRTVLSKMRSNSGAKMRDHTHPFVFSTCFPESAQTAAVAVFHKNKLTLRQKWGSKESFKPLQDFAVEFLKIVG